MWGRGFSGLGGRAASMKQIANTILSDANLLHFDLNFLLPTFLLTLGWGIVVIRQGYLGNKDIVTADEVIILFMCVFCVRVHVFFFCALLSLSLF